MTTLKKSLTLLPIVFAAVFLYAGTVYATPPILGTCIASNYSTEGVVYGINGATFSHSTTCTPPSGTVRTAARIALDDGGSIFVNGQMVHTIDEACGIKYAYFDVNMNAGVSNTVNWTSINCGLAGTGASVEFDFYGAEVINQAPTLTLLGGNPITINIGTTYTDAGATAQDLEDGNITANIVVTGSVNTGAIGIYTITYNVKDSAGVSATPITRTVNVVNPAPAPATIPAKVCLTPNTLGDNTKVTLGNSWDGASFSLQNVLNGLGFSVNAANDQIHAQTWTPLHDNTTITIKSLFHKSDYDMVFGYLRDDGVFHPIYKTANFAAYASTSVWAEGEAHQLSIAGKEPVTFAIYVFNTNLFRYTKNLLNANSEHFALSYNVSSSTDRYLIAFEDLSNIPASRSDSDYNDVVVQIISEDCADNAPVNHPPVITLIGANPITVTIGQIFTDPGATANDQEDGNITSSITASSTVNTAVVGTYTITYNVKDSGGLSASPVTRTVNVVNLEVSCPSTRNGWYTTYYNYASTTLGMELPMSQWGNSYGDPLSSQAAWTANWYDSNFARFSKVDSNLLFGDNFFPFDTAPEEIINGHDYHFGLHSKATLTASTTGSYAYNLTSDDDAWIYLDGELVIDNRNVHPPTSKNGSLNITAGSHTLDLFFAERHTVKSFLDFSFTDTTLVIKPLGEICNHPPVITLVGANPISVIVGSTFSDPGATAFDQEDGDITSKIVASSTVNINVVGSYTITYNVKDSQGLAATPVSRTVNVLNGGGGGGGETIKGKITFCLMIANNQNVVATSSSGLPAGTFLLNLASSTSFATSSLQAKTWTSGAFSPNTQIISSGINDADCVTFTNLELGTYYYSELQVSGALYNTPKYNDKFNQPINNVFDFFNYSPELFNATSSDDSLRNMNSDGQIILTESSKDQGVVVYETYNPAPQCVLPQINSSLTSSVTINTAFSYTLSSATSTDSFLISTSTLPSWLTFATTTNVLSGTPTETGTFSITMKATNTCGTDTQTLVITVNPAPPASSGGGGGGGGGTGGGGGVNGPIVGSFGGSNGPIVPQPQVAGASTSTCYYLYDFLRKDFNNNPIEVKKLQIFLKELEGFSNLVVTGIYDDPTIAAVDAFQIRYKDDVLLPWGYDGNTGTDYTYILTKKKVNEIYCKMAFPVTPLEQAEIDAHRAFWLSLKDAGITVPGENSNDTGSSLEETDNTVGSGSTSSDMTTLAGVSSTTQKIAKEMTANVLSAGKRLGNLAFALISWPFGSMIKGLFGKTAAQCVTFLGAFGWLNILLLLIIVVISYLWYREHKNNKKLDKINEEIDLK